MPAFSFVAQGEGNNVAGGKLILAGGILETGTGQIFINGLNAVLFRRCPVTFKNCIYRSVAQLGRALRSGRRGRVFESRHSDFTPILWGFFIF